MKQKNPKNLWAVHYVDSRAKDKAKRLAKANKQTIGPWLSDLILNENSHKVIPEDLPLRMLCKTLDNINEKIEEISLQLVRIRVDQPITHKNKILNKIFG